MKGKTAGEKIPAMKSKTVAKKKSRSPSKAVEEKDTQFLGQKLKTLMGYYGIPNYRELSRRVGVGFETLRLLHTGEGSNPNIKNLYPLARFYDVPIEILINDSVPVEDILQWVGMRFIMDQPEQRLRCPNIRRLVKTLGYNQVTEEVVAQYYDKDGSLVCLTIGRNGDVVYQGPERRRPPAERHPEA